MYKKQDEYDPLFKEYAGLANQEKYDEAIKTLDKLLAIKPKSTVYLYHKAIILSKLKRYQEAITWYTQVLDIDKYNNQSLLGLANALYYTGSNNKALEYFDKATIPKTDTESLLNKASALYKEKRFNDAVAVFGEIDSSILDSPDVSKYGNYSLYYADSLYQTGCFDEAAIYFEKITDILDQEFLLKKANAICKSCEKNKDKEDNNKERWKKAVECF